MTLFINISTRNKTRKIAFAAVSNLTEVGSICDYEGIAWTLDEQGEQRYVYPKITGHDRDQCVWALIEKIAKVMQGKTIDA